MGQGVRFDPNVGDGIRDFIAPFSAPLLAVSAGTDGEVAEWAASGTLVSVADHPCVLTASHVARGLRQCDLLGLSVARGLHRYAIRTEHVRFLEVGSPAKGKEADGPDLAVLILPRAERGNIDSQMKSFWNLDRHRTDRWPDTRAQEEEEAIWAVAGVPAERSKVGPGVSFMGGLVGVSGRVKAFAGGGFHYLDLSVGYEPPARPPEDFGGMSGSGLWLLHTEPRGERVVKWKGTCSLAGVLFYQTAREGDHRWLRCHGPEDVYGSAYEAVKRELGKA